MPKRLIDFEAMWASDKLAACAEWAQVEYAWVYGLADANGSFELTNVRVIWGRVAPIRKNLSAERLEQVFEEFREKGLLFVWEENGKKYGHWTGSDRPGRLPAPALRVRFERLAPRVPAERLADYVRQFGASAHGGRREGGGQPGSVGAQQVAPPHPHLTASENLKPWLESTQGQDRDRDMEGEKEFHKEPAQVGVETTSGAEAPVLLRRVTAELKLRPSSSHPETPSAAQRPPPEAASAMQTMHFAYEGTCLRITERQDSVLNEAFPWVEKQSEYRKMNSWLEANPLRRPKNASRFAHNWFSRIPPPFVAGARHEPFTPRAPSEAGGGNYGGPGSMSFATRAEQRQQRTARALNRVFGASQCAAGSAPRVVAGGGADPEAAGMAGGVQRALPAGDQRAERSGLPARARGPDGNTT